MLSPERAAQLAQLWQQVRYYLTRNHYSTILIHLALMGSLFFLFLYTFFNGYLPNLTNHGETVRVPDLRGMHISELEKFLETRDLRFEIADTTYEPPNKRGEPRPFTILKQNPAKGTLVKKSRKIYLTVNAENAPDVLLPSRLLGASLETARIILQGNKLLIGEIRYKADMIKNTVLAIEFQGEEITKEKLDKGYRLPQGSKLVLYVSHGMGDNELSMPNVVGKDSEVAIAQLVGMGLKVEERYIKSDDPQKAGQVLNQSIPSGRAIVVDEVVEITIAERYNPEAETE
ncbi:PASTA domain-containing protein [Hugenholtzia roseola]|uniref:PASTA domain-containing protein n=1 Tax=Hugenholtzia roseola TaxID=1002 RepID=UPI000428528C|nr:PASTA domain-containing protein [Hugenholtzia roseola]